MSAPAGKSRTGEIETLIVTGDRGTNVTIDAIRHRMGEAYNAIPNSNAGQATDVTTHGLRYTTVAVLTELGCDDNVISTLTGHETVATVRKYQSKKRHALLANEATNAASEQRKNSSASAKVQNRSLPLFQGFDNGLFFRGIPGKEWWAHKDSNLGPAD